MTALKNMSRDRPVTIAILAGGSSRRMGSDKASLELNRVSMLDRVAAACRPTGLPVIVVGRANGSTWESDLAFAPDLWPDAGPLGGLYTAFCVAKTDVLLVGCDMPWLSEEAVLWLLDRHRSMPNGVVAERDRMEPLFAVYPLSARDQTEARLSTGTYSLMGLLRTLELPSASVPVHLRGCLDDADTPTDLKERNSG